MSTRSGEIIVGLGRRDWLQLLVMGVLGFSLGNTFLYIGLESLPATTTSFLLNGIPILTVVLGILVLGEKPHWHQWVGIIVAVIGGMVYFGWRIKLDQGWAILWSLLGVLLISIYGILARSMTRRERIDPISLSAIPMGFGGFILLLFAFPIPRLSMSILGIVAWLTFINSAMAFVLWNGALKHMQAFEISITANLMPVGTAIIAPVILGEVVSGLAWVGMAVSLAGVLLVGVGGRSPGTKTRTL